jgi:hypothetical protein
METESEYDVVQLLFASEIQEVKDPASPSTNSAPPVCLDLRNHEQRFDSTARSQTASSVSPYWASLMMNGSAKERHGCPILIYWARQRVGLNFRLVVNPRCHGRAKISCKINYATI